MVHGGPGKKIYTKYSCALLSSEVLTITNLNDMSDRKRVSDRKSKSNEVQTPVRIVHLAICMS